MKVVICRRVCVNGRGLRPLFALYRLMDKKGIQEKRQSWILDTKSRRIRNRGTAFSSLAVKLGFWILDSNWWDYGFLELYSGFRIPQGNTS